MTKKQHAPRAATLAAKKATQRWMLGVFESAAHDGKLIAVYCRKDGTISPSYAKGVTSKRAKFHASYKDMTYAQAREQLMKDSGLEQKTDRKKVAAKKPAAKKATNKEGAPLKKAA